jgi:hypothetical protein
MQWSTVHTYLSEAEAAIALASLEAGDIPAQLEPRARSILGISEVAIMVPADRLPDAERLLSGHHSRRPQHQEYDAPVNQAALEAFRRDIQRWRWAVNTTVLVFIGAGITLSTQFVSPRVSGAVLAVALVSQYACAGVINRRKCPRCGGYFFSPWDMRWFYTRDNCRQCGLSIRA